MRFVGTMNRNLVNVVLEIHRNISVANVYFKMDRDACWEMSVQIRAKELVISLTGSDQPNGRLKLVFPEKFFIPSTLYTYGRDITKLRKSDEMVEVVYQLESGLPIFRLHIDPSHHLLSQELENLNLDTTPHQELQTDTEYFIVCSSCSNSLVKDSVTFKKIANLPFDYSELSEIFFCHQESHDKKTKVVSQPANALFLTPTCYVLSCLLEDVLSKDLLLGVIRCKDCSSILCYTKRKTLDRFQDSVFCFKDKVKITSSMPLICDDSSDKLNTSLKCLISIIQDTYKMSTMCKLYLEAKMPLLENDCILIWVLDPNMKRFTSSDSHQPNSCSEEIVKFTSVMKVLYHVTHSVKDFARTWVHDFSVDFHHISNTMLLDIKDYLLKSSFSMPVVKGYPDQFEVGYIPL